MSEKWKMQKIPDFNPLKRWSRLIFTLRDKERKWIDTILGFTAFWNILFIVVLLLLASQQKCGGRFEKFEVGQVAPYDITSPFDFENQDEKRTTEKRDEARRNSIAVYSYDSKPEERLISSLSFIMEEIRKIPAEHRIMERESSDAEGKDARVEQIFPRLPKNVTGQQLSALRKASVDEGDSGKLLSSLAKIARKKIVLSRNALPPDRQILIRYYHEKKEELAEDLSQIVDLDEAENQVKAAVGDLATLSRREKEDLGLLLTTMIDANLNYDLSESVKRQDEAARDVPPVVEKFPKGTILIRKGDRFDPETLNILKLIDRRRTARFDPKETFGFLIIFFFAVFFLWRYDVYHQREFRKFKNLHALMVIVLLVSSLIGKGIIWIGSSITDNMSFPFNQPESYYYLVPVAAGAMLITLLANGRIALAYSLFSSLVFGIFAGWDLSLMFFSVNSSFGAIYGITQYKMRTALLKAGFVVGAVNVCSIIAIALARGQYDQMQPLLFNMLTGFLGGVIAVPLLVSFLLPILEWLFNILTDIRLLELSNLNSPLLSQFALKAPGSYNHSLVMASIAETAAEAIGANALFCRVAAYYHDIGKMSKPSYFVENQIGSFNPHERLSPSMSTLILISHIKEGIRFAKEQSVPQQIVDIIPQHHGTRLITYFYQKAKKNVDPNLPEPDENAFRYPGPKPQTKEAAIFMLADAIEAAARTIESPTPAKMKEMIKKLSGDIVLDEQLDQCDLTFSDLEKISNSFVKSLSGIYHHRIDYPGYDFDTIGSKSPDEEI